MLYHFTDELIGRSGSHFHCVMTCFVDDKNIGKMDYTIRYQDGKVTCSHVRAFHFPAQEVMDTACRQLLHELADTVSPRIVFYPQAFSKEERDLFHRYAYPVLAGPYRQLLADVFAVRRELFKKDVPEVKQAALLHRAEELTKDLYEQDETILYQIVPQNLRTLDKKRILASYQEFDDFINPTFHEDAIKKSIPLLDKVPKKEQTICSYRSILSLISPLQREELWLLEFMKSFHLSHMPKVADL